MDMYIILNCKFEEEPKKNTLHCFRCGLVHEVDELCPWSFIFQAIDEQLHRR